MNRTARPFTYLILIQYKNEKLTGKLVSPNIHLSKNTWCNLIAVGIFLVMAVALSGLYHLINGML